MLARFRHEGGNNSLFDCNRRQHNGIGNLGDSFGNIVFDGSSGIGGTGTYIGSCSNNSILKAGQGRAATVCAITLGGSIISPGYPTASNKVHIDSNFSDAATNIQNDHTPAVPVSSFAPPVGILAAATSIESTSQASLVVKSTNPNYIGTSSH